MDDFRFCAGYMSGLWDGMIAIEGEANYKAFCPPLDPKTGSNEVDNGQVNAVFLKYLHSNPMFGVGFKWRKRVGVEPTVSRREEDAQRVSVKPR